MSRYRFPDSFSLFVPFSSPAGWKDQSEIENKFRTDSRSLLVKTKASPPIPPYTTFRVYMPEYLQPDLPSPIHIGAGSVFDDLLWHGRARRGCPNPLMISPRRRRSAAEEPEMTNKAPSVATSAATDSRQRLAVVIAPRPCAARSRAPSSDLEVGWTPARPRTAIAARPALPEARPPVAVHSSVVVRSPVDGSGRGGFWSTTPPAVTRTPPSRPVPEITTARGTAPGSQMSPSPPPPPPGLDALSRSLPAPPRRAAACVTGGGRQRRGGGFELETVEEEGAWL